jgi:hypothetical protein
MRERRSERKGERKSEKRSRKQTLFYDLVKYQALLRSD